MGVSLWTAWVRDRGSAGLDRGDPFKYSNFIRMWAVIS